MSYVAVGVGTCRDSDGGDDSSSGGCGGTYDASIYGQNSFGRLLYSLLCTVQMWPTVLDLNYVRCLPCPSLVGVLDSEMVPLVWT